MTKLHTITAGVRFSHTIRKDKASFCLPPVKANGTNLPSVNVLPRIDTQTPQSRERQGSCLGWASVVTLPALRRSSRLELHRFLKIPEEGQRRRNLRYNYAWAWQGRCDHSRKVYKPSLPSLRRSYRAIT